MSEYNIAYAVRIKGVEGSEPSNELEKKLTNDFSKLFDTQPARVGGQLYYTLVPKGPQTGTEAELEKYGKSMNEILASYAENIVYGITPMVDPEVKSEPGQTFGNKLKELRGQDTIRVLASTSQISDGMISELENGIKNPSLKTIKKLAKVFGSDNADILGYLAGKLPDYISKQLSEDPVWAIKFYRARKYTKNTV